jgi:hypothetical protein
MSVREFVNVKKIEYEMGDTDETIYKKCVQGLEGLCNSEGYVIPGSTEIIARTFPVNMIGNGRMNIHAKYSCQIGMIENGDILDVQVKRVTKGVGALASVCVNGVDIANVILPDDIQEPGKRANENEIVKIQILTRSFALGWDTIRCVGKII